MKYWLYNIGDPYCTHSLNTDYYMRKSASGTGTCNIITGVKGSWATAGWQDYKVGKRGYNGNYSVSVNCTTFPEGQVRFNLQRVNSSTCAVQASSNYSATYTATGTWNETLTLNAGTWGTDDLLRLNFEAQIASHGAQTWIYTLGSSCFITEAFHDYHIYVDPDATEGSGATLGINWDAAYRSLEDAEAEESTQWYNQNVVSNNMRMFIHTRASGGTADTPSSTIDFDIGWATNSTCYVTIATNATDRSQDGNYATGKYRIESDSSPVVAVGDYDEVYGLQIKQTADYVSDMLDLKGDGCIAGYCILEATTATVSGEGLSLQTTLSADRGIVVFNTRVRNAYGKPTSSAYTKGIQNYEDGGIAAKILNCDVCGWGYGIETQSSNTTTVKNCAVFDNYDNYGGPGTNTISYCASDALEGTNATRLDSSSNYANEFTDYANGDLTRVSGNHMKDAGDSTAGTPYYSDDITGFERDATWDIGVFESVGAVSYTIQAVLDAFLQKKNQYTAEIDAYIQKRNLLKAELDSILQIHATFKAALDAALIKAQMSKADLDAYIQQHGSFPAEIDAFLKISGTDVSELDAILQQASQKISLIDAYVKRHSLQFTKLDSVLAFSLLEKVNLDSVLNKANELFAELDALVNTSFTKSAFLDSVIVRILEKKAELDAIISSKEYGESDIDALLLYRGTIASKLDVLLNKANLLWTLLDARLEGTAKIYNLLDAVLAPVTGSVTWGHHTDVVEDFDLNFSGYWTGTGSLTGSGDSEKAVLDDSETLEIGPWRTGQDRVGIYLNEYGGGVGEPVILYATTATQSTCASAPWQVYSGPFNSLGWVKIQLSNGTELRLTRDGWVRVTKDDSVRRTR